MHILESANERENVTYIQGFYVHSFTILFSADLFYKPPFVNLFSRNTIRVSIRLDRDQARRFVGPDLGLNCL